MLVPPLSTPFFPLSEGGQTHTEQGSWPSPINRNRSEARRGAQARLDRGAAPVAEGGAARTSNRCLAPPEWGRAVSRGEQRSGVGGLPPFVVLRAGGTCRALLLPPLPSF